MAVIEHLLLDLDGPILDGKKRHYQCYADILHEHGFQPVSIETYWQMKRERLDRRCQLSESQAEAIYDKFLQIWLERIEQLHYLAYDVLQPGVLAQLRNWRQHDVNLTLVTMRHDPQALKKQLQSLGIADFFDNVIVCDYTQGGQGKAAKIKETIPCLKPESTIWVGDTEADIEAARQLQVKVIALSCGLRTESYLLSLKPDLLYWSLQDINLSAI